jgi:gas vesicle protein
MSDEENTGGRNLALGIIAGVAIGALIGAALGVLFAPQPGKQTRERLGENLSEMLDKVKSTASSLIGRSKEQATPNSDMGDAVG